MTAVRLCGVWLSPALLLGVSAHLYAGAPAGLLLALLVVVAPCMALIGPQVERRDDAGLLVVALTVLAAVLVLSANLLLIGDVASALGAPRWHGIVIAAGCAFALTIWRSAERWWPWLTIAVLALVWVALAAVAHASGAGPGAAWSGVASRPAFRFAADSPWVVSGGTFPTAGSLVLSEAHTLRAVSPDVFTVIVADGAAPSAQEWRPAPGEAITLRPGDRVAYPAGARLRFEEGKRVPGAPRSGAAWADLAPRASWPVRLVEFLGLAVTFVAGGRPLLRPGAPSTPAGVAVALALLLAGVGWAEGWAVYAASTAPDLFLGTVPAGSLVQLPALAVGGPWGRRLGGVLMAAVIALFAATASGLRERVAALDRGGEELGRDLPLWMSVFGVAVVASLSPRDPFTLLVIALGVLASTLGPLALAPPATPARTQTLAGGVGLAAFVCLGLGGRLIGGAPAEALAAYPALVGAPAALAALRLARSRTA